MSEIIFNMTDEEKDSYYASFRKNCLKCSAVGLEDTMTYDWISEGWRCETCGGE